MSYIMDITITPKELVRLYLIEGKTVHQIAKYLKRPYWIILRHLRIFNISKKHCCIDCGEKLKGYYAKRCKKCYGKSIIGRKPWNWKGMTRNNGYILIYSFSHPYKNSNNYVREHRLVIEKQIGRYLKPEEVSHHLNEIKDDNRPQNLMAFINDSVHHRFHINPNNVKLEEIIFDGRKLL